MKTFQNAGVICDFCIVAVRCIKLSAIFEPGHKQFLGSTECALKSQLLAHWDGNVAQCLHKAGRC